jgi:hypothetical protein
MSGEDKGDVPQNTQDLTVFVQNLLQQMVEHRTVGRACWRVSAASVAASQLQPRARERWRVDHSRVPHAPPCAFHQLQQQRFQDMSDAIIQRSASAAVPTRAPPCWHALSAPCLPTCAGSVALHCLGALKALEPAPAEFGHSVRAYAVSAFGTKALWRHLSVPLSNLVVFGS